MQVNKINKRLNDTLYAILEKRGIEDKAEFLSPSLKNLSKSKQIEGAYKTVKMIQKIISQKRNYNFWT